MHVALRYAAKYYYYITTGLLPSFICAAKDEDST